MTDFRIGTRLAMAFSIVILIVLSFAAFACMKVMNIDPAASFAGRSNAPAAYLSEDLRSNVQRQSALFQKMLATGNRSEFQRFDTELSAERGRNSDLLTRINGLSASEKVENSLREVVAARNSYSNSINPALDLLRSGNDEAKQQVSDLDAQTIGAAYDRYLAATDDLVITSRSFDGQHQPGYLTAETGNQVLIFLAAALLGCCLVGWVAVRSITKPLALSIDLLEKVSEGDLAARGEVYLSDELGRLITLVNRMLDHSWSAAGVAERLAEGDDSVIISPLSDRDILGRSLARLKSNLQLSTEMAQRLAEGDLSTQMRVTSEKDKLGVALNRVRDLVKQSLESARTLAEVPSVKSLECPSAEMPQGSVSEVQTDARPAGGEMATSLLSLRDQLKSPAAEIDHQPEQSSAPSLLLESELLQLKQQMMAAAHAIERIAGGDFSMPDAGRSEHDLLGNAVAQMQQSLRRKLEQATEAASQLLRVSSEVVARTEHLWHQANTQREAAAETTRQLNEPLASLQQATGHFGQTDQLASDIAEQAKVSADALNGTVVALKDIAERITVLGDISRKTDLLTLAGAVEAARAGEHGLGFAVVATELRKIGEQTQTTAAEVIRLANNGLKTAGSAGESFERLVPAVHKTAELARSVVAVQTQQNAETAQTSQAAQHIDELFLQNVSASRELLSATEQLISGTDLLQSSMGVFKLTDVDSTVPDNSPVALQKSAGG